MLIKPPAVAAAMIAATPTLAGSALAAVEERYALDVPVFRDGVQVIGGRTLITEEKQAELSLTDGDLRYKLNADLNPVQGDGDDDQLSLNVNTTHSDDQPDTQHDRPVAARPASRSARRTPPTPGSMVTSSHWSRSPPTPARSGARSANSQTFRMSAKGGKETYSRRSSPAA